MWCSLEPRCRIDPATWRAVGEHLSPRSVSSNQDAGWDRYDDWLDEAPPPQSGSALRLASTLISCSPELDLFVFALGQKFAIVSVEKEDNRAEQSDSASENSRCKLQATSELGDHVTCAVCIPVAANQRSPKGYDWTCVLIGSESGDVRFYAGENRGAFLFSEKFATESVRSINLHSSPSGQQLSILHDGGTIATIDGLSLYTAVKTARNQVLQGRRDTSKVESMVQMTRKEALNGSATFPKSPGALVSDRLGAAHTTTHVTADRLSQMVSASILGGSRATITQQPPSGHLSAVSGGQSGAPFLGFHWSPDQGSSLRLVEAFSNAADKVKSVVANKAPGLTAIGSSFLGSWYSGQTTEPHSTVKATSLDLRFQIRDANRLSTGIYPMPGSKTNLFAVTDNRARVCLTEGASGLILRMWKGFRDAQCGFVVKAGEIPDHSKAKKKKACRSSFLVLYAPRNGVLEVHPTVSGPRAGAFNVTRDGKVLQISPHVLGQADPPSNALAGVLFLDETGVVKKVKIPFHITLQDESSQALHDLAVLKELRNSLINWDQLRDPLHTLYRVISEFRTRDSMVNCIRVIRKQSTLEPPNMDKLLGYCIQSCQKLRNPNRLSVDEPQVFEYLADVCESYRHLINLYVLLKSILIGQERLRPPDDVIGDDLATILHLDDQKLTTYMTDLNECLMARSAHAKSVKSMKSDDLLLTEFLESFDVEHKNMTGSDNFHLHVNLTEEKVALVGNFVFSTMLIAENAQEAFANVLPLLQLRLQDSLRLFLTSWLFKPHSYSAYPPNVVRLLVKLVKSAGAAQIEKSEAPRRSENVLETEGIADSEKGGSNSAECLEADSGAKAESPEMHLSDVSVKRDWLLELDKLALEAILSAEYLPETMALCIVVRAAILELEAKPRPLEGDVIDDDLATKSQKSEESNADFELVSELCEKWDNVLFTAHSVLPILTMGYYLTTFGADLAGVSLVNLKRLVSHPKDPIIFLVSNTIVDSGTLVQPSQILKLYGASSPDQDLTGWEACFMKTLATFQISLDPDHLLANLAMNYSVAWDKNPDSVDILKSSVSYAKSISNPIMQHGMANLIWMSHLNVRFQKLVDLMEKIGKFPKDRLCRRDVGLSEERVVDFAVATMDVLNSLFEANSQYEVASLSILEEREDFLDVFFEKFAPPETPESVQQLSLTQLAFHTKCTNYHLVRLHWQLAIVVKLMLEARLRPSRPFALFDAKGKGALFKPLHSMPLLPRNGPDDLDPGTQVARSQFFRSYVSAMLSATLPYPPHPEAPSDEANHPLTLPSFSDMCTLLQEWEMETDQLWIHCILELYSLGYDYLAERKMCLVQSKPALGSELLILAGQRMATRLADPDDPLSKSNAVALLSPTLRTWLKTQDTERLLYRDTSIQCTRTILHYVLQYLPKPHAEYGFADALNAFLAKFN